jgi:RpiB/LacA/LacB family sugar-phosphate isomerase
MRWPISATASRILMTIILISWRRWPTQLLAGRWSGVGACIAANKVRGARACLIHDTFSAHQGVEDDDLNIICLGGRVIGDALAWEIIKTFLTARFSGAERHKRRLAEVAELEMKEHSTTLPVV